MTKSSRLFLRKQPEAFLSLEYVPYKVSENALIVIEMFVMLIYESLESIFSHHNLSNP